MDQELFPVFDLIERRLALMRALADSLERAQTAVAQSNLVEITGHTARQRELCAAVRQLESEARQFVADAAIADETRPQNIRTRQSQSGVSPLMQQRWNAVAEELSELEIRVGQLNRIYGALLRRARRTVDIFCRVLASSAVTYAAPRAAPAPMPPRFEEVSHV
jgi:flagellar FlgN protein